MMEAYKFCKTANQPTTTKCKNYYCESKCSLHVYLRDILKKAPKNFYTSNVVILPAPLSPTPLTSMKTPEKKEEDPGDPDLQMK
jgi:hypothetical protein